MWLQKPYNGARIIYAYSFLDDVIDAGFELFYYRGLSRTG